ncbi:MAG: GNAT family N-acetyltransferase [Vicinamibacterales bacterium]
MHVLDPLTDTRWTDLLDRHPRASVFHSRGWLQALKRTYGYEPVVLTTSAQGPLENGLALCRVSTWLARRLVSLPFSDHCDPLMDRPDDLEAMLEFLTGEMEREHWRSLELRPRPGAWPEGGERPSGVAEGSRFCLHTLDLAQPEERIFRNFHASSTQRAIRRAEREGLTYEAGRSEPLLSAFYRLLRLTRRRHGLPPQPMAWFRNLIGCIPSTRFARSGQGATIHVASKDGRPVAGILTLTFKQSMVYKYGGSDAAYHPLGGMPFLFWRAIQAAKALGVEELDLGRSDLDQPGLVAFKEHLGGVRSELTYYTRPEIRAGAGRRDPFDRLAREAIRYLPDAVLDLSGRFLYKHLG